MRWPCKKGEMFFCERACWGFPQQGLVKLVAIRGDSRLNETQQEATANSGDAARSTDMRWQGANWRCFCRYATAITLISIVAVSWLNASPSADQILGGAAFAAAVFVLSECLFARRMGVCLESEGLTLCGPIRRTYVPWASVRGLTWRSAKRGITKARFLYVDTDQSHPRRFPADAPLRMPTFVSVSNSNLPNDRLLGSLLTSNIARAEDGNEADALELFSTARINAGQNQRRRTEVQDGKTR